MTEDGDDPGQSNPTGVIEWTLEPESGVWSLRCQRCNWSATGSGGEDAMNKVLSSSHPCG